MIKDFFANYEMRTNDFTVTLGNTPRVDFLDGHEEDGWTVTLTDTGQKAMTGARLKRVAHCLDEETFCFTYGDGIGDVNIGELLEFHRAHGKLGTVTGVRPPSRFGELALNGNQVASFTEKPQVTQGYINGGFFVFEREFIDRYLDDREDLTLEQEPLNRLAADGELMMYAHDGFWQPMDTYREMQHLESLWNSDHVPWKLWDREASRQVREDRYARPPK